MREDLLHFIWKYKKLQLKELRTTKNIPVTIENVGEHNHLAGPDFFNAKLSIGGQLWAGNVEVHLKSSDWYVHNHEKDDSYNNVILHVVWEDDVSVFRANASEIPTLELKSIIPEVLLENYRKLFSAKRKNFINCENDIKFVDSFEIDNWLERLYFERLEHKSDFIFKILKGSQNNWEEVLFALLLKNFGSKINGEAFLQLAEAISYDVFKKVCNETLKAESLLFGCAGLLDSNVVSDLYFLDMQKEFAFLHRKFELGSKNIQKPEFFRLRPANFPTIRLSQIANLYAKHQTLFGTLMDCSSLREIYDVFNVSASEYWDNHFTFGKLSKKSKKRFTKPFIDLIIINTILPLKFCYAKYRGKDASEIILPLISSLSKEKNSIVDNFEKLPLTVDNAKGSQAALQLYNEYCTKNKCLQCAIGNNLLNRNG